MSDIEGLRPELTEDELRNPDLEGIFDGPNGEELFDRRYSIDFVENSPILTPRTADLNLIGPEIVKVPERLKEVSKTATRGQVKLMLLARGLPGVNV